MQQQIEKQYVENAVQTTRESVIYTKKLIAISFSYVSLDFTLGFMNYSKTLVMSKTIWIT